MGPQLLEESATIMFQLRQRCLATAKFENITCMTSRCSCPGTMIKCWMIL